jgi:hypothetical protein
MAKDKAVLNADEQSREVYYEILALWLCCTTSDKIWEQLTSADGARKLGLTPAFLKGFRRLLKRTVDGGVGSETFESSFLKVRKAYSEFVTAFPEGGWNPTNCPGGRQIRKIAKLDAFLKD